MAIGWLATMTSGRHGVKVRSSSTTSTSSPSSSTLSSALNYVNNEINYDNNSGSVESGTPTSTKMFPSHRHHRHNHHRKLHDPGDHHKKFSHRDDNDNGMKLFSSNPRSQDKYNIPNIDGDERFIESHLSNSGSHPDSNSKYSSPSKYDIAQRPPPSYDTDTNSRSSNSLWYSRGRKHMSSTHPHHVKSQKVIDGRNGDYYHSYETSDSYFDLRSEGRRTSITRAVRNVDDDNGGAIRNQLGLVNDEAIFENDLRKMAKRTIVASSHDKKQYDAIPFNTDENSNSAHFDVEFFPEHIENEKAGFPGNQNETITTSDYLAGGVGDKYSDNNVDNFGQVYLNDETSDDPFSSVPWGSSSTNNAPNVAEFQKGVYNDKYKSTYRDSQVGSFDQNSYINRHPFLNLNNNNDNNNSLTDNALSDENSNNLYAISSFFQDGNFNGSFSQDPIQNYHLDFNGNKLFFPNNLSSLAATSTSPSGFLENMDDMLTGTGNDFMFSFNNTVSGGANSNLTDGDSSTSGEVYMWILVLMIPLVIFGIAGNTLVILAISLERRLQNITNYFLLSLAVTDLLVSLIVWPFSIINMITGHWQFGLLLCDFFVTSDVLMCTSSIFHLCFISAERYIGIRYPLWSKNKSKRVVLLKIVLVWTLAFAVTSPISILGVLQEENILVDGRCNLNNEHFIIYGSIFAFFIPLSIMVLMYILTVRMLAKQAKLCHKRRGEDGEVEPMIRRSTSSKRWHGRNKFYGGNGGGGGGGGFQSSFRNHDLKEHILDPSGTFHQHQGVYDTGVSGVGGGGLRSNIMSNTLPHYKSTTTATSPNKSNSHLRRGVVNTHRHHEGRGGNSVMLSSSCGNSPIGNRNGLNKNRTSASHADSIVLTKNTRNGKQRNSASTALFTRRSKSGGFFISKNGSEMDGKNNKKHNKNNLSEYQFCNGHRSDSSEESSKEDNGRSGNRSSSPNDNNNKLKDLVRKHHVALKAANILLMRRVDSSQPQSQNLHHTMSPSLQRTSTTTPPSSTKVSIRRDNSVKTEQKASKVLGVVFIIFVICWAPFFIVNILQVLCSSCNFSSTFFTAFVWLGYVSSTLNPIIYTIFNNIFRNTFIKLLCCRYRLLHRARRNSNLIRKENGMLASSTCSATFNTASTILTSSGNNCSIITNSSGGNSCNISFRHKASTSINAIDESKC